MQYIPVPGPGKCLPHLAAVIDKCTANLSHERGRGHVAIDWPDHCKYFSDKRNRGIPIYPHQIQANWHLPRCKFIPMRSKEVRLMVVVDILSCVQVIKWTAAVLGIKPIEQHGLSFVSDWFPLLSWLHNLIINNKRSTVLHLQKTAMPQKKKKKKSETHVLTLGK